MSIGCNIRNQTSEQLQQLMEYKFRYYRGDDDQFFIDQWDNKFPLSQMKYEINLDENYPKIKALWKAYYERSMRDLGVEDKKAIDSLFYNWDMSNWKAMWKQNSEYADYDRQQLYATFVRDIQYSADRISFDRLFRANWMYREVFKHQIWEETKITYNKTNKERKLNGKQSKRNAKE